MKLISNWLAVYATRMGTYTPTLTSVTNVGQGVEQLAERGFFAGALMSARRIAAAACRPTDR